MSHLMEKIEQLVGIPIYFTIDEKSVPKGSGAFLEEESPFFSAPSLVGLLLERGKKQELPVVYQDENKVFYVCVRGKEGFCLTGPVCTEDMDHAGLRRFYEYYGISAEEGAVGK